jgi:hypothetical protein
MDDHARIQLDIPPLREDNTNVQEAERIIINEQTRTGRDRAYYVQLFFDFVRANMGPTYSITSESTKDDSYQADQE